MRKARLTSGIVKRHEMQVARAASPKAQNAFMAFPWREGLRDPQTLTLSKKRSILRKQYV
jgi:hypothetical protein